MNAQPWISLGLSAPEVAVVCSDTLPKPRLEHLVFPFYRPLLSASKPGLIRLAAVAPAAKAAAALGVIVMSVEDRTSTILSLAVDRKHRRRGIGRTLLLDGLEAARKAGAVTCEIGFTSRMKHADALTGLLTTTGWKEPEKKVCFAHADPTRVFNADWAQRCLTRGPRHATPFDWSTLTSADRGWITREIAAGSYPAEVSPFWDEENITETSLGLRDENGRIVGWLVIHVVPRAPGMLRYSRSFSMGAQRFRGNGPWLMAEALNRHVHSARLASHPTVLFDIDHRNGPMMNVFQRRLAPLMETTYDSYTSTRELTPA